MFGLLKQRNGMPPPRKQDRRGTPAHTTTHNANPQRSHGDIISAGAAQAISNLATAT
jgi:hypothetical protein